MLVYNRLENGNTLIYSDNNFYILYEGYYYDSISLNRQSEIKKVSETNISVPSPYATKEFVADTFVPKLTHISEEQIVQAHNILLNAINDLSDLELYKIKFLLKEWQGGSTYYEGEKIIYKNYIYDVLNNHIASIAPENDKEHYEKIEKPMQFLEEWNKDLTPYQAGDRIKNGNHIYESVLNNNVWSPVTFPAAWNLIQ